MIVYKDEPYTGSVSLNPSSVQQQHSTEKKTSKTTPTPIRLTAANSKFLRDLGLTVNSKLQ